MSPTGRLGFERPNILWLDAEDLSPDLGCYAHPLVHTPNIDMLASEGVRFENAFVTGPVCSASRSAVITGTYQTSIGAHNHRSNRETALPEGIRPVPCLLSEAGYFTSNGQALAPGERGKLDYNFRASFEDIFQGTGWSQRRPGQPFFAQVHFHEAHREFRADHANRIDPDDVSIPPYYPDHPITRTDWALYLETIQNLDRRVGAVLERLEEESLAENTAVFLWGDHGRAMVRGKQFLYDGGIHVPLIVRWPRGLKPDVVRRLVSMIDLAPTWLQLACRGIPDYMQGRSLLCPAKERDSVFAARDRCDETVDRIRCVRTRRYKYIRNFHPQRPYAQFNAYKKLQYPVLTLMEVLQARGELSEEQARFLFPSRPSEELYDLQEDPHELRNLAESGGYRGVLEDLRWRLDAWIRRTGDQGGRRETRAVLDQWRQHARTQFEGSMAARGLAAEVSPEDYLRWWERKLKEMHRA